MLANKNIQTFYIIEGHGDWFFSGGQNFGESFEKKCVFCGLNYTCVNCFVSLKTSHYGWSNNTRPIEQKSQYKPHYIRKISKMSETEIFQMLRIFDNNQT